MSVPPARPNAENSARATPPSILDRLAQVRANLVEAQRALERAGNGLRVTAATADAEQLPELAQGARGLLSSMDEVLVGTMVERLERSAAELLRVARGEA